MTRRNEIAKEIERRKKELEHLSWVASTKLTKWHERLVAKEIEAERVALAQLVQAYQELAP